MADGDVIAKIFSKMDADNSGTICESEMSTTFRDFDNDASGTISREEWIENIVSQFGATTEQAATMFAKLDSTGQGHISVEDLVEKFKAMDADGNGTITREEFFDFWSQVISLRADLTT